MNSVSRSKLKQSEITGEQKIALVSAIMDHPSYKSETAEQWMNKHGWSFKTITEKEAAELIKKLWQKVIIEEPPSIKK